MSTLPITVEARKEAGKKSAKAIRKEQKVPVILYGEDKDPAQLAVTELALRKALTTEWGRNVILELKEGDKSKAMVRALQVHPLTDRILHADLLRVDSDKPIKVDVPLTVVGEAPGIVQQGGQVDRPRRSLEVLVKPSEIPFEIEVSIDGLWVGQAVLAESVTIPDGCTLLTNGKAPCVVVQSTRATKLMKAKGDGGEEVADAAPEADAAEDGEE